MIAGDINRDAVNRNRLAAFFMPRQQKGVIPWQRK